MVRVYRVHLGVHAAVVQPPLYVVVLLTARRVILLAEQRITVVTQPRKKRVIERVPRLVLGMRHHLVRLMRRVRTIPVIIHQAPSIITVRAVRHPVHAHCPVFHVMQITINLVHHVRRVLMCLTQIVEPTPKQ